MNLALVELLVFGFAVFLTSLYCVIFLVLTIRFLITWKGRIAYDVPMEAEDRHSLPSGDDGL